LFVGHHRVILRRAIRPDHLLLSGTSTCHCRRPALSTCVNGSNTGEVALANCCTYCDIDKHPHPSTDRGPRCCTNERIPSCFAVRSKQWLNARGFNVGIFWRRIEVDDWAWQCCPVVAVRALAQRKSRSDGLLWWWRRRRRWGAWQSGAATEAEGTDRAVP
jgi:hypothetical protein